jgi:hypothetical protein
MAAWLLLLPQSCRMRESAASAGAVEMHDRQSRFPQSGMVLRASLPPRRHCERSEAIQIITAERLWIASLRSQ